MLSSLLITLGEGLEAALTLGIVLAYLARVDSRQSFKHVWVGTALAVGISLVVGLAVYLAAGELLGKET